MKMISNKEGGDILHRPLKVGKRSSHTKEISRNFRDARYRGNQIEPLPEDVWLSSMQREMCKGHQQRPLQAWHWGPALRLPLAALGRALSFRGSAGQRVGKDGLPSHSLTHSRQPACQRTGRLQQRAPKIVPKKEWELFSKTHSWLSLPLTFTLTSWAPTVPQAVWTLNRQSKMRVNLNFIFFFSFLHVGHKVPTGNWQESLYSECISILKNLKG